MTTKLQLLLISAQAVGSASSPSSASSAKPQWLYAATEIKRQTEDMKRLLLLLPLLLGSQVTPAGASAYSESFGYEEGYKACIRSNFTGMSRDIWNLKSKLEKDQFRAWVHQNCK